MPAEESVSVGISESKTGPTEISCSIRGSNLGNRSCHSLSEGRWPTSLRVLTSA